MWPREPVSWPFQELYTMGSWYQDSIPESIDRLWREEQVRARARVKTRCSRLFLVSSRAVTESYLASCVHLYSSYCRLVCGIPWKLTNLSFFLTSRWYVRLVPKFPWYIRILILSISCVDTCLFTRIDKSSDVLIKSLFTVERDWLAVTRFKAFTEQSKLVQIKFRNSQKMAVSTIQTIYSYDRLQWWQCYTMQQTCSFRKLHLIKY